MKDTKGPSYFAWMIEQRAHPKGCLCAECYERIMREARAAGRNAARNASNREDRTVNLPSLGDRS
jgi:hypothetical protein